MLQFSVFCLCIDIDAIMQMYIIVDIFKIMYNELYIWMYLCINQIQNTGTLHVHISHQTRTVVGFYDVPMYYENFAYNAFLLFYFLIMVKHF